MSLAYISLLSRALGVAFAFWLHGFGSYLFKVVGRYFLEYSSLIDLFCLSFSVRECLVIAALGFSDSMLIVS